MRYIVECEDPSGIYLGAKLIQKLIETEEDDMLASYDTTYIWYVRKTKSGYSAREFEG